MLKNSSTCQVVTVEIRDGQCRQGEVVGQKGEGFLGGGVVVLDTPQFFGIAARRADTSKHDGLVEFEPRTLVHRARIQTAVLGVGLGSDEEKGTNQSQAIEPSKIQIAAIHDVESAWL